MTKSLVILSNLCQERIAERSSPGNAVLATSAFLVPRFVFERPRVLASTAVSRVRSFAGVLPTRNFLR